MNTESSQISLIIEQFDKGQKKYTTSQTPSLAPSASIPDALYIPARLSHQSSLTEQNNNTPVKNTACDSLVTYYMNSIDYLTSYFQKFCTSIDSITKLMSLSASIYFNDTSKPTGPFNQYSTLLNANFELVTLGNRFEANQIQAMPIIETSLLKTLQSTLNFFLKPKTGYCALYKNENIVLLMDSEPKATKVPLMGM